MFANDRTLRIGMIGLDTSHVVEFTKLLNHPAHPGHVAGAAVVAAFRSGSADMPERSMARVPGFARELTRDHGVRLCESIAELVESVDAVMIENVDGRKHLEIARQVFPAGKPVFIDKPLAGSLADAVEIVKLAERQAAPCFCASTLRFAAAVAELSAADRAGLRAVLAHSPCDTEPHHPDLFWYGVHGIEMLYALLGQGCETVARTHTRETDLVTGRWSGERVGVFCGHRGTRAGFGYKALLERGFVGGAVPPDYAPLVRQIVAFFRTRRPPVTAAEMLEVLAFMEAADESRRLSGAPVSVRDVLRRAGAPVS